MKSISYILYEEDPDSRTGLVNKTPIAIFSGNSKEEAAQGILHIMAKHLANANYTQISEYEAKVSNNLDRIKEAVDTDNPNIIILIDNTFFFIQPFEIESNQTILPAGSRISTLVNFDEETRSYVDVSCQPINNLPTPTYEIEIVNKDANTSPFLSASPFVVRGNDMYAIDAETSAESGPFQKADWFGGYYLVYANGKGGIISMTGKVIADCIYDRAYNQNGYVVLVKNRKLGFFSPYEQVLIPCDYDEFEFPDDSTEPLIVIKDNVRGLVDSDGTFHPLTDVDPDPTLNYL